MHSPYPDIDLLRRQAKRLLRQAKEGDPGALRLLPRADRPPQLADAQYAVAKVVGFPSWPALVRAVGSPRSDTERLERRTRLILVRNGHGDSGGRFSQHDGPRLDEVGRAQAMRAATRLAQTMNPEEVDGVVSSLSPRSIETAQIISSILETPHGEPTCDLCQMHPGAAEGLTQQEMAERFGPNYAFVPGAEAWLDFVPRATEALEELARAHSGRTVIGVIEGAMVKASFIAFGKMPLPAAEVIMTDYASITEWSCLVEGDVRRLGTWRLERYNEAMDAGIAPLTPRLPAP
jgi:broad specificity phosphatase PhoE